MTERQILKYFFKTNTFHVYGKFSKCVNFMFPHKTFKMWPFISVKHTFTGPGEKKLFKVAIYLRKKTTENQTHLFTQKPRETYLLQP